MSALEELIGKTKRGWFSNKTPNYATELGEAAAAELESLKEVCDIWKRRAERVAYIKADDKVDFDWAVLERVESMKSSMDVIRNEAEYHRNEYSKRAENGTRSSDTTTHDYWAGRRDEAGHFRDRIAAILAELDKATK